MATKIYLLDDSLSIKRDLDYVIRACCMKLRSINGGGHWCMKVDPDELADDLQRLWSEYNESN